MFETAILSRRSSRHRSFALPGSILLHAAAIAALLGATLWRFEEMAAPMQPIILVDPIAAPPPRLGSRSGLTEPTSRPARPTASVRLTIAEVLPALPGPLAAESGVIAAIAG